MVRTETVIGLENVPQQIVKVAVVVARAQRVPGTSVEYNLASHSSCWLQQDGIHVGMRSEATRFGLRGLSPSDFSAIGTHGRVVRHVLRFEWRHTVARAVQVTAQCGRDPTL